MKFGDEPRRIPLEDPGAIFRVSFHPDGTSLALGLHAAVSLVGFPELTETGALTSTRIRDDGDSVEVLRHSPDGRLLAVAGLSGRVLELVRLDNGSGDRAVVEGVSWAGFSPGSSTLVATGGDQSQVVDLETEEPIWRLEGTPDEPDGCLAALNAAGDHVAALRANGAAIDLVELSSGAVTTTFTGGPSSLRWLAFTSDDRYLVAFDRYAESMAVWCPPRTSPHLPDSFGELASYYWSAACHPQGTHCARGMISGVLDLVDLRNGRIEDSRRVHSGRVLDLAFSPDGEHLVSAGEDGTVLVWPILP
ncbi:MAG TPA: WD40 repeat domain-containing protein [Amycolatopsis sp.]|nr:WD40 repeat domain-containing protein [Amycolatopsis sp.]